MSIQRKPAPSPGLIENVPFEEYRAWDAVNVSALKDYERSAQHVHDALTADESEETPSMVVGRALHTLALEGKAAFTERFTLRPAGMNANSGAYQTWKAAQTKTILTDNQAASVTGMFAALGKHAKAKSLLAYPGAAEVSCVFDDPETGVRCKMRIDRLLPGKIILDLKTASDASTRAARDAAIGYGYDIQAEMYVRGVEVLTGKRTPFVWAFVESDAPHAVNLFTPDDAMQKSGILRLNAALQLVKHCRETGVWPLWSDEPGATYSTEVRDLPPPVWRERELSNMTDPREVTL